MAPPRSDDTLRIVLEHLRSQDDRFDEFRDEIRVSHRAARAESQGFREEVLDRVSTIETVLKVEEAKHAQVARWAGFMGWAVGVLVAVAAILVPLLWGRL